MRISIAELGGLALSRLLQAIEADGVADLTPHTLAPELIVRESTTACNTPAKRSRRYLSHTFF